MTSAIWSFFINGGWYLIGALLFFRFGLPVALKGIDRHSKKAWPGIYKGVETEDVVLGVLFAFVCSLIWPVVLAAAFLGYPAVRNHLKEVA